MPRDVKSFEQVLFFIIDPVFSTCGTGEWVSINIITSPNHSMWRRRSPGEILGDIVIQAFVPFLMCNGLSSFL